MGQGRAGRCCQIFIELLFVSKKSEARTAGGAGFQQPKNSLAVSNKSEKMTSGALQGHHILASGLQALSPVLQMS